jgi:hypothetical protein
MVLLGQLARGGLLESGVVAGVAALHLGAAFSSPHELSALVPGLRSKRMLVFLNGKSHE